jgi:MFS family permease
VTRRLAGVSIGWLGISMIVDGVPTLLVPHQIAAAGRPAAELGMVTLVGIGLGAIAQPFAGAWSDQAGRWPAIGVGLAMALGGLALILNPATLLTGTVLALIGVSVVQAGYQGLLPDGVAPQLRGRAAGLKGFFDVGGAFLAFLLLAALLADGDAALSVLLLGAGLGLPIGLSLLLLRGAVPRPGALTAGWRQRLRVPGGLSRLIVARFSFLLGIFAVGRFLLLFIAERRGLTADAAAQETGLLLATLALLTAFAALPGGWMADRVGRRPLMFVGGALAATGIFLMPFADSTALLFGFGGLLALGSGAFGAASWAMLADLSAGVDAGRLLGIANLGTAGAAAAAGLFGPLIEAADAYAAGSGYTTAFFVAGAVTALGAILTVRLAAPTSLAYQPAIEVPD